MTGWSNWSAWSDCDVTCGGGTSRRSRGEAGERLCEGRSVETKICGTGPCEGKTYQKFNEHCHVCTFFIIPIYHFAVFVIANYGLCYMPMLYDGSSTAQNP